MTNENNEAGRPPPEHFLSLIRAQQRGRLKIYLGFAPGVGKTYKMLQDAHVLKRQGVDLVVGVVETHGRADTAALIEGLEQVPRRRIEYRGVTLEEMDQDALLRRKPTVALVDELAHTNAPDSRNAKRYQDVEELLRDGINVITTVNIQHVESLYDMIEGFTGVKVKERVPDYILAEADEVVYVDLASQDLQERLKAGKVYPAERIESALANFFQEGNLSRLRELASEEIAHLLDRRRHSAKTDGPPSGAGRVMVCLSSRSPNAPLLLRKGARLADRMHAPWHAVYIRTPAERIDRIDAATQRKIADAQDLALKLGAFVTTYSGKDFPSAIADYVRDNGITVVVLGRSRRPWYKTWFGPSPLDRLTREMPRGVDVLIVDTG
ncbi:MAG TPA: universal stress protein [Gemmataceae bacterium]|nr:universal stress protein [Gemmataceae bacterium]